MGKLFSPMANTKNDKLEITIMKNGPAIVRGSFTVTGPGGPVELTEEQKITGVAFCRCGRSRNQPFCDGSHAKS